MNGEHQGDLFYRPSPQLRADTKGMVRSNDLSTSFAAAGLLVPKRNALQLRVLDAIREHGAMTDEQLENLPQFVHYGISTVKKRRTELYQRGEVVIVGEAINSRGSRMKVWDLTERGKALAPGGPE